MDKKVRKAVRAFLIKENKIIVTKYKDGCLRDFLENFIDNNINCN